MCQTILVLLHRKLLIEKTKSDVSALPRNAECQRVDIRNLMS